MAASSRNTRGTSRAGRKIVWLAGAVILACGLYTAGWYGAAEYARPKIAARLAGLAPGVSLSCAEMEIRGFPFRFGLHCARMAADDTVRGIAVSLGSFRSAAQVYQPSLIVSEVDGPAEIRTTDGMNLSAEWDVLSSSLRLAEDGPERISTVVDNIVARLPLGEGTAGEARAGHGELHLRDNGGNLDLALLAEQVVVTGAGAPSLPPLATSADITLTGEAGLLKGKDPGPEPLRNRSGTLNRVVLDLGEGRVATLSGPFSVDGEGLLSGTFTVEVENVAGWKAAMTTALPQATEAVNTAASALTALAAGQPKTRVTLTADKGRLSLAFIPLGDIPPL